MPEKGILHLTNMAYAVNAACCETACLFSFFSFPKPSLCTGKVCGETDVLRSIIRDAGRLIEFHSVLFSP